jgi:hypothetical protein
MKRIVQVALLVSMVWAGGGSAHATATDNAGTATSYTPAVIDSVSTTDTTWSKFRLLNSYCSPQSFEYQISKAHPVHAQIYQTVLAAYLANKPVMVRYESGANGVCWVKAVTVVNG